MSLILDALQKADDDRQRKDDLVELGTTDEDEVMTAQTPAAPESQSIGNILFIGISIAIIVILAISLWLHISAKPVANNAPLTISRDNPAETTAGSRLKRSPTKAVDAKSDEISEQYRLAREQRGEQLSRETASDSQKVVSSANSPVDALYAERPTPRLDQAPEPANNGSLPVPEESMLGDKWNDIEFEVLPERREIEPTANTQNDKAVALGSTPSQGGDKKTSVPVDQTLTFHQSLPTIRELNESQKDKIPSLFYTQHQFNGEDGSYIIINKSLLRNGNTIVPGVILEEILKDGFIGKQGSTRFKVKALSSWVNM